MVETAKADRPPSMENETIDEWPRPGEPLPPATETGDTTNTPNGKSLRMRLLDRMLRASIREGSLEITDADGRVYRYGDAGAVPVRIRFDDPRTAWRITRDPELGAGEAYMDGTLTVAPPHDIRNLLALFVRNTASTDRPPSLPRRLLGRALARLEQNNTQARSRRNAIHHYDLSRRFYELFLDRDRHYTMAYFRDPEGTEGAALERAQQDKAALIAAKLRLHPGMRVLDIGCGWGSFALYLHRHYGVDVLGISLAPDQVAFASEQAEAAGVADHVRFRQIDYRALAPDVAGKFDRITSLGMFEHVGAPYFATYFKRMRELLADDGVMLTHTIGRLASPDRTSAFTRKYIFPGGYVPSMSEVATALEQTGWLLTDLEVLRTHYAHTLAEWYRRTCANRAEIEQLYDSRLFRMWQFYLAGAEQSFRYGRLVNFQIQSTLRRDVLPITRDYIHEEAERLFALNRLKEDMPRRFG